jgi:hypothetical protein
MREAVAVTMRPDDLAGQVVQPMLDKVPRRRPL